MKIPKLARRAAKELFRGCLVNGLLDEGRARQVVQLVLEGKPRAYLAILARFQHLVKLDIERRTARIESAVPLNAELQNALQSSLGRVYGPGLNIGFVQDTSLIGGMRIKVGSDVYDGSIQGKLTALQESF